MLEKLKKKSKEKYETVCSSIRTFREHYGIKALTKKALKKCHISVNDKFKERALLITKIVFVVLFFLFYMLLWTQELYRKDGIAHWKRVIIPTILFVVPSFLLFVKIKIPKGLNTIISVIYSAFVVYETFRILQMSQGYSYNAIGYEIKALNYLIIVTIFIVFYAIFNSFKASIIALNILTAAFGLANYFVVMFRGTGLLAVDLLNIETAANVAGGYEYTLDFNIHFMVMVAIALSFLAMKLGKNTYTKGGYRIFPILLAIVMVVGCYKIYFVSSEFDKTLKIKYFKPQETFNEKGMYAQFVKSIKDLIVDEPKGYSINAVEKIAKDYPGTKATVSQGKEPNIIVIMNEAFNDFSAICDLDISQDCMPYFHSMKENTIKGKMYTSIFGGGTAATEFEVLTSNSMAFIPNGITAYTTYINDPMSSMATVLKSQNYGGMQAMHPYKGSGYKREKVYPLLGFDEFITMEDFDADTHRCGKHISDVADVSRIISEYEELRQTSDAPYYMFNVTMQNHSPFNASGVSNEIKLGYNLDIPEANQYMNLMKASDDSIKTIVEYFKQVEEPTIILFFGDHQPKLEDEFYEEIEKTYTLDEQQIKLAKYNTPYFIWANYDIEEKENYDISANYLAPMVLETAGLGMNGYEQFVSEVRKQVPILTKHGYIGNDGVFYENGDKDSPYYDILQQYNILEYNNIFDVKNRVDELFE